MITATPAACPASPLRGSAPSILKTLAPAWRDDFVVRFPDTPVELLTPFGPPQGALDPGLEAFLEGRADFAFLTREIAEADLATFRKSHRGVSPSVVPVATGAWDRFGYVDAVAIVVNSANPIRRLSYRQLDAIFSSSRLRGGSVPTDWAALGVAGWRGRPIHILGGGGWAGEESARALTIRRRILSIGGRRGRWKPAPDSGSEADVVDRVAADPLAIGFTGMGHLKVNVRPVAIALGDRSPAYLPTAGTIAADRYPLARTVDLLLAPATACGARLRTFARYLLSDAGQAQIGASGVFQPLSKATLRRSLQSVDRQGVRGNTMVRRRPRG
ncbi:PstS family phosphate ABC transporter substrate-binding protein [Sphingomonas panacisoli]|nr:substrate-binding domain-containing protein [Sphingomonas panacisoli]